jgi:hypothetical protein
MNAYLDLHPDGLQKLQRGPQVLNDVRNDREPGRGLIPVAQYVPLHVLPARIDEIERG